MKCQFLASGMSSPLGVEKINQVSAYKSSSLISRVKDVSMKCHFVASGISFPIERV